MEQSARSETEARRRLSISETSSSSRKEVMSLSSLVEANKVEVERLSEELDLQSKSHSLRIAELQESFQAKIREMRRVHAEQMASSREQLEGEIRAKIAGEATTSASALAEERAALAKEASDLRSKLQSSQAALTEAEKKLRASSMQEAEANKRIYGFEKQNKSLNAVVMDLKAKAKTAEDATRLKAKNKSLAEKVERLRSELYAKQEKANEKEEALMMLVVTKQRLVKISALLSAEEEEIEVLKLTDGGEKVPGRGEISGDFIQQRAEERR